MKLKYYGFESEIKPPFRVDVVDHFTTDPENKYYEYGTYPTLEEAIKTAEEITIDRIQRCECFESWEGCGEAGLVYDAQGLLIWSGTRECRLLAKKIFSEKSSKEYKRKRRRHKH